MRNRLPTLCAVMVWFGCTAPVPSEVSEPAILPGRTQVALRVAGAIRQDDDTPRLVARVEAIGMGQPCQWVNTRALRYWYTGIGLMAFLMVPGGGTPVSLVVEPTVVDGQYVLELPLDWSAWTEETASGRAGECRFSTTRISLVLLDRGDPAAETPIAQMDDLFFLRHRATVAVQSHGPADARPLAELREIACAEGRGCRVVGGTSAGFVLDVPAVEDSPASRAGLNPTRFQDHRLDIDSERGRCIRLECDAEGCDPQRDCAWTRERHRAPVEVAIPPAVETVVPLPVDSRGAIRAVELGFTLDQFRPEKVSIDLEHEGRRVRVVDHGRSTPAPTDLGLRGGYALPVAGFEGTAAAGEWKVIVLSEDDFFSGKLLGLRLDLFE